MKKQKVLEHLQKYNNFKTKRIYKENLNVHINEYIIERIYKYKKYKRSMSEDQRKDPFRNIIKETKADFNQDETMNKLSIIKQH